MFLIKFACFISFQLNLSLVLSSQIVARRAPSGHYSTHSFEVQMSSGFWYSKYKGGVGGGTVSKIILNCSFTFVFLYNLNKPTSY